MKTFDEYLAKQLQDPDFKAEYEALEPEFAALGETFEADSNKGNGMEKLYLMAHGYRSRFPEGFEPFQMVTRILEECGEVASEVNLWEGTGVKRQKHGNPSKENLANEIKQAFAALAQVAIYYNIEDAVEASINSTLAKMADEGLINLNTIA